MYSKRIREYTSYEVLRRRKGGPVDREARADAGKKLRALYLSLGMDLAGCAQFLQVSERTLHNWQSGRHVIPFAVMKLLRLLNRSELPGPTWAGWFFVGGKLVSPEGRTFVGTDASWWGLLVRQAAMFRECYARESIRQRLERVEVAERRSAGDGVDSGRAPAAGPGGAPLAGGWPGTARSAGPNLFQSHIATEHDCSVEQRERAHA